MKTIEEPKVGDFLGLAFISMSWGTSFFFVELALRGFSPSVIAAGRISIAAVLLYAVMRLRGESLPRKLHDWALLYVSGFVGTAVPFFLISWGQSYITSSQAAILMSFTPLATLFFAHFMTHDEKMSAGKLAGILLGFSGVVILMGGVDAENLTTGLAGKGAILLGAVGYALSSLLLRKVAHLPTFSSAAGVLLASTSLIVPMAAIFGQENNAAPPWESILALVYLGTLPSALAVPVLMFLLRRVGAVFVTLNNYLVPVIGSIIGVLFLNEQFGLHSLFGLGLILTGVLLTQIVQMRRRWRMKKIP